ncbi:M48 family peptidase, partial [bacterium]|nr:M48 family peptidase [bacterium]
MNTYLIIILFILLGEYLLNLLIGILNVKYAAPALPKEFTGYYNANKYTQSQTYLKENTIFSLIEDAAFTLLIIFFILLGGFNFVDQWARSFQFNFLFTGLLFAAILVFGSQLIHIPFGIYQTFVIEEKYGFN